MTALKASFPRTSRIKLASEIRSVLRNGNSVRNQTITVYVQERNSKTGSRLGIIVSKRVFKKAVDRNRVKRIVREFFRTSCCRTRIGYDVIVRFVKDHNLLQGNNLRDSLNQLFTRSGIMK